MIDQNLRLDLIDFLSMIYENHHLSDSEDAQLNVLIARLQEDNS